MSKKYYDNLNLTKHNKGMKKIDLSSVDELKKSMKLLKEADKKFNKPIPAAEKINKKVPKMIEEYKKVLKVYNKIDKEVADEMVAIKEVYNTLTNALLDAERSNEKAMDVMQEFMKNANQLGVDYQKVKELRELNGLYTSNENSVKTGKKFLKDLEKLGGELSKIR